MVTAQYLSPIVAHRSTNCLRSHGKDSNMRDSGGVTVIDDLKRGQLDLHWCSIACMRQWLLELLDEVEADVLRENKNHGQADV